MNLHKMCVVLVACVAATVSMSACSAIGTLYSATPSVTPSASSEPAEGDYDEWENATSGRNESDAELVRENLAELSDLINEGLDETADELIKFELPGDVPRQNGWFGVSKYHENCVIAVLADEQTAVDHSVSLLIMTRYDTSVDVGTPWSANYAALGEIVQHYTDWCDGGPLPEPFEMDEEDVVPDLTVENPSQST